MEKQTEPTPDGRSRGTEPPTEVASGVLDGLVGYHLRRAHAAVFEDFARALQGVDVTPGQFGAMQFVAANPGLTQTALGAALGLERSTVVGLVDKLEARGLIRRTPSETDRRSNALALTGPGFETMAQAEARIREHEDRITRTLAPAERDRLIDLLRRLGTAAQASGC